MPLREFTDADDVAWQVYEVYPSTRARALSPEMEAGWLVFESASHKIRVYPIPADWGTCSEEGLLAHRRSGVSVPKTVVRSRKG